MSVTTSGANARFKKNSDNILASESTPSVNSVPKGKNKKVGLNEINAKLNKLKSDDGVTTERSEEHTSELQSRL